MKGVEPAKWAIVYAHFVQLTLQWLSPVSRLKNSCWTVLVLTPQALCFRPLSRALDQNLRLFDELRQARSISGRRFVADEDPVPEGVHAFGMSKHRSCVRWRVHYVIHQGTARRIEAC